ncbi:hypothetical protein K0U00_49240, partial [Paenibacillus sepulcri]|nr:hypothetical protein [Paenibacillus sepulcri]
MTEGYESITAMLSRGEKPAPADKAAAPTAAAAADSGSMNAVIRGEAEPGSGAMTFEAAPGDTASAAASDVVLEITDLHKHFTKTSMLPWKKDSEIRAVNGISFKLQRGETIGIV